MLQILLIAAALPACRGCTSAQPCTELRVSGPGNYSGALGKWPKRPFSFYVPAGYDEGSDWPVLLEFHGGGGKAEGHHKLTCPDGELHA